MTSEDDHHVDHLLQALGPRGKFTVFQILSIILGLFPALIHLLLNVFIGFQIPHNCSRPENETSIVSNFPLVDADSINITYGKCSISVISNTTMLQKTGCVYGMDYQTDDITRSFVSDFDLVCDTAYLARLSQTVLIAGQGMGALTSTFISDRLGRKPVIWGSNLGLLIAGLGVTFAPNYYVFLAFKFLIGAAQQGVITSFSTYLAEILKTTDRRLAPIVGGAGASAVNTLLDLLAYALRDYSWRTIELIVTLFSLSAFFQWWYQEESLRWLVANGKTEGVKAYITRAAKCNGINVNDIKQLDAVLNYTSNGRHTEAPSKHDNAEIGNTPTQKLTMLDIFKVRRLAITTVVLFLAWITAALGYFGIYLTSTKLSGNPYLNFLFVALMEAPSHILFYFSFNRIGRRWSLAISLITLGISLILSGVFKSMEQNTTTTTLALISFCVGMVGASGAFSLVFAYTPELYPTNVRNQAVGMCSLVSRIGGMVAPFMGLLGEIATWGPGLLIGCLALFVTCLLPLVPETNGKELPQSLEDIKLWYHQKDKKQKNKRNETKYDDGSNDEETPVVIT